MKNEILQVALNFFRKFTIEIALFFLAWNYYDSVKTLKNLKPKDDIDLFVKKNYAFRAGIIFCMIVLAFIIKYFNVLFMGNSLEDWKW